MTEERSYDRFEPSDLDRLAFIARHDLESFVARNPHHSGLEKRILVVALCQGAAMHYVDGANGVKDFDVWTFFADDGDSPEYPVRRRGVATFGGERFRTSTRRVDLLGRTLKVSTAVDMVSVVQGYLERAATKTAWHLAQKAVVLLEPEERRGEVIWRPR